MYSWFTYQIYHVIVDLPNWNMRIFQFATGENVDQKKAVNPWSAEGNGNKGKDEGAGANVDVLWFSMVFYGFLWFFYGQNKVFCGFYRVDGCEIQNHNL